MKSKILFFVLSFAAFTTTCLSEVSTPTADSNNAEVVRIYDCNDCLPLVFKCDIKNYPPIIGRNISIKIRNAYQPKEGINSKINAEIQFAIDNNLPVIIKNMERDKCEFAIIADVFINGKSLSEKLIKNELAHSSPAPSAVQEVVEKPKSQIPTTQSSKPKEQETIFVASKNGKAFHYKDCRFASRISPENIVEYSDRQQAIDNGKTPCKSCKP